MWVLYVNAVMCTYETKEATRGAHRQREDRGLLCGPGSTEQGDYLGVALTKGPV